jgi:hypothetical protein
MTRSSAPSQSRRAPHDIAHLQATAGHVGVGRGSDDAAGGPRVPGHGRQPHRVPLPVEAQLATHLQVLAHSTTSSYTGWWT